MLPSARAPRAFRHRSRHRASALHGVVERDALVGCPAHVQAGVHAKTLAQPALEAVRGGGICSMPISGMYRAGSSVPLTGTTGGFGDWAIAMAVRVTPPAIPAIPAIRAARPTR